MGYTIIAQHSWQRFIIFLLLVLSLGFAVFAFLPTSKKLLTSFHIAYYTYTPTHKVENLAFASHVDPKPAVAVPILMYHGVIEQTDDTNTTIKNFVSVMEMLKENGYQTITLEDLDLFMQGKYILPPKPIIITFDDGRKDSYYTTDDVLKKLGFNATIFVATGPTIDGNSFYLTYDELRTMKATGRWDIEAHGRYSHKKIPITKDPKTEIEYGRYLTSKIYLPSGRLETNEEFKERVESDYRNNIIDLETRVATVPHYFAIPLNDYGQQPISNYSEAVPFNQQLIEKYFRLAFIQANNSDNVLNFTLPVYNFQTDNPYRLKRIEMKNMSAEDLKAILIKEQPVPPEFNAAGVALASSYDPDTSTGHFATSSQGLTVEANAPNNNGQVLYGKPYWEDYTVTMSTRYQAGRSLSLVFNYKDGKNYMVFGVSDNSYFLRSTVNDVTTNLVPNTRIEKVDKLLAAPVTFKVVEKNGIVGCYINGKEIFTGIAVPVKNGETGLRVWSNTQKGKGIVESITIHPS